MRLSRNDDPDRPDAPISSVASLSQPILGKPRRLLRAAIYWLFWLWLALVESSNVGELIQYYVVDPETYNRVFRDPGFYFAMVWAWTALFGVAIGFQAVCWRKGQVSLIAVTISAVFVCYLIANVTFGIHKICCG